MADGRATAPLAAAGGVLRRALRPPHLLMAGGYLLDRALFGGDALCLTVLGFDPELMRLAVFASPFMHAGMLVGCAADGDRTRLPAFAGRFLLQLGCMLAAMAAAAHLHPGSPAAGLISMLFAMIALEAGGRLIAVGSGRLLHKVACIIGVDLTDNGHRPLTFAGNACISGHISKGG